MLFEQQLPQLAGNEGNNISSPVGSVRGPLLNEYDSEEEYEIASNRRASVSTTSSSPYPSSASSVSSSSEYSDTDEEDSFLRRRERRMQINSEMDPNNIVQQRALNRLNELCHQISPEITAGNWRTEAPPSAVEPEPVITKPTMEGPGMPGVPGVASTPPPPEVPKPQSPWTNPVYIFVITACVIPITILAVTAVVYPSPRTWSLLKAGVKTVCSKLRG